VKRLLLLALLAACPERADATQRLVAVGGAVTEIVYALGHGDRLVAVDSTSRYPAAADALPDVGYMRRLSAEPILALRPNLVLAIEHSGPAAALEQLRAAGVRVEVIGDEPSAAGIGDKVRAIGAILGASGEASALAARIEGELQAAAASAGTAPERPRVLFLIGAGKGAPMAAGTATAADAIIGLAGGRNAVEGFSGYKPLSPEAAVAARPDVVLVMTQTAEAMGGDAAILGLPGIAATPAGAAGRLVAMDGMLLLGFGPRTPEAVRQLARALHPALKQGG
jgi:iron complex transport system substrate-binding protein